MKRHSFTASLALAVLTVLGLAGPVLAGEQVPFKGSLEGDLTRTPLDPPFVLDRFNATGNATQLGQFELLITATVNTAERKATGSYLFVAANGDRLAATFDGRSMPTATPGVILIIEDATIDPSECTGRFAGASGDFTCERFFDTVSFTTDGSFEGTITTPSASKR